ncbi:unnamed protein product [Closterium sp. NIES-64]|nr:unnamed protein product [Closterium sp. NIES-64]
MSFPPSTLPHRQSAQHIDSLRSEVDVLLAVRGLPCVVRVEQVVEEPHAVHVVMEACGHGDLFDYIAHFNGMPEPHATCLFRQIVVAVAGCHGLGIIHRDIKPENIFLSLDPAAPPPPAPAAARTTSPNACTSASTSAAPASPAPPTPPVPPTSLLMRLGDFGLALFLHTQPGAEARGRVGSSYYMAPEVVRGGRYGLPADVWSLGVILYIMLSGFVPFWGATSLQTFEAICSGRLDLSSPACVALSPAAKALLRAMLSLDPAARPTAHQVLSHPWLSMNKAAVEAPHKSIVAHPWVSEHEVEFETPQNPVKPDLGKASVETSPGTKGVRDMGLGKGLVDRGGVLAIDGMGTDCMGDDGVEGDAAGVWGCEGMGVLERSILGLEDPRLDLLIGEECVAQQKILEAGRGVDVAAAVFTGDGTGWAAEKQVEWQQGEGHWACIVFAAAANDAATDNAAAPAPAPAAAAPAAPAAAAPAAAAPAAPAATAAAVTATAAGGAVRRGVWSWGKGGAGLVQAWPDLTTEERSSDDGEGCGEGRERKRVRRVAWDACGFSGESVPPPVCVVEGWTVQEEEREGKILRKEEEEVWEKGESGDGLKQKVGDWEKGQREEVNEMGCRQGKETFEELLQQQQQQQEQQLQQKQQQQQQQLQREQCKGEEAEQARKGERGEAGAFHKLQQQLLALHRLEQAEREGEQQQHESEQEQVNSHLKDQEREKLQQQLLQLHRLEQAEREGERQQQQRHLEQQQRQQQQEGGTERATEGAVEGAVEETRADKKGNMEGTEVYGSNESAEEKASDQQQMPKSVTAAGVTDWHVFKGRVTKWDADGRKSGVSLGPQSAADAETRPRGQAEASGRDQAVLRASGKPVLSSRGEAELKMKGKGVLSASGDADVMKGSFGSRMRGLLNVRPAGGSLNEASMGGAKRRRVDGRGTASAAVLGSHPPSHSPARLLPPRPAATALPTTSEPPQKKLLSPARPFPLQPAPAALPTAFEPLQKKPLSPACLFPPRAAAAGRGE